MQNMNEKDKKILYELDKNSRQPISKIAKNINLSKQNTFYRIKKLEKDGIIKQYYSVINFTALGYKPYKIFLRMNNLAKKEIDYCLAQFKRTEYVVWAVHCDGIYDIIIGLISKNTDHFRSIYFQILDKFQEKILLSDYSTIISAHQSKKYYLSKEKYKNSVNNFYVDQKKLDIDNTDSLILSKLAINSTTSIVEISKILNITPEAVRIRIKNLNKNNILLGSSIIIDVNKINYLSYKILFNLKNKSEKRIQELINFLNNQPEIIEIINVMGKWDLEIDLDIKNINDLNDIITLIRIKFKDLIYSYNTLIKYQEYSYNYYPVLISPVES